MRPRPEELAVEESGAKRLRRDLDACVLAVLETAGDQTAAYRQLASLWGPHRFFFTAERLALQPSQGAFVGQDLFSFVLNVVRNLDLRFDHLPDGFLDFTERLSDEQLVAFFTASIPEDESLPRFALLLACLPINSLQASAVQQFCSIVERIIAVKPDFFRASPRVLLERLLSAEGHADLQARILPVVIRVLAACNQFSDLSAYLNEEMNARPHNDFFLAYLCEDFLAKMNPDEANALLERFVTADLFFELDEFQASLIVKIMLRASHLSPIFDELKQRYERSSLNPQHRFDSGFDYVVDIFGWDPNSPYAYFQTPLERLLIIEGLNVIGSPRYGNFRLARNTDKNDLLYHCKMQVLSALFLAERIEYDFDIRDPRLQALLNCPAPQAVLDYVTNPARVSEEGAVFWFGYGTIIADSGYAPVGEKGLKAAVAPANLPPQVENLICAFWSPGQKELAEIREAAQRSLGA